MKLKNLLNRFKEPSTWAALAMLSLLFGVKPETAQAVVSGAGLLADVVSALAVSPELAADAVQVAPAVVAGVAAVLLPEKARE